MSARYSTSPSLHLTTGKSRIRDLLFGALCLCTLYALFLLYARGYAVPVFLFLPLVVLLLWHLRGAAMPAVEVCWRQGVWTVTRGGRSRVVRISGRSTCLPWVIYLAWSELPAGRAGFVWLFADSAQRQQLRRLRGRLSLERSL